MIKTSKWLLTIRSISRYFLSTTHRNYWKKHRRYKKSSKSPRTI